MFDLADTILIWTLRFSTIALTGLAILHYYREKNRTSFIILLGMFSIFISETANYLANLLFLGTRNIAMLERITDAMGYLTFLGCLVSIAGCYVSIFSRNKV